MASQRPVFILDEEVEVIAPVHIRMPRSSTSARGNARQEFITRTAFVTFRLPSEEELDAVLETVRRANEETAKAVTDLQARLDGLSDEEGRPELDAELVRLRQSVRLGQVEQLKAFIVGLPDNSGIGERDGTPASFSPELVERLCAYRPVRTALWEAFLLIVNGDGKRGN